MFYNQHFKGFSLTGLKSLPKNSFIKQRQIKSALIIILFASLSSCGRNSGLTNQFSTYGSNTNVILSENNYKVVGTVKGSASDFRAFGFGGFKKDLVARAKQNMLDSAKLEGTSRAVINMSLERHKSRFPILATHTITVHGTVIEFLGTGSNNLLSN